MFGIDAAHARFLLRAADYAVELAVIAAVVYTVLK